MNDIQHIIDKLKSLGYEVWGPENTKSYVFFTEITGTYVGYVQYTRMEGVHFCTVHKPGMYNGTGFGVPIGPFDEQAKRALSGWIPNFATAPVNRYRSFDEFRNKYWQRLIKL